MRRVLFVLAAALGLSGLGGCSSDTKEAKPKGEVAAPAPEDSGATRPKETKGGRIPKQ